MIQRIIIHKSLIDSFKRKAVKMLPKETIVAILGKQVDDELYVYAFDSLNIRRAWNTRIEYEQPEEEMEAGTTLKYFGTLHSHSNGMLHLSEMDKKSFLECQSEYFIFEDCEGEQLIDEIMGIMGIARRPKVIQYGIMFYNNALKPIELIISETIKK